MIRLLLAFALGVGIGAGALAAARGWDGRQRMRRQHDEAGGHAAPDAPPGAANNIYLPMALKRRSGGF